MIILNFPKYIILWLQNFLLNRFFAIRINNVITDKIIIGAGVPQGAVLSPFLFSIYINDIPMKFLKNKWYSLLFADDLCSFYIFKSKKTTAKQIQLYFDSIENWLRKWRLMMAPHKCNYIVVSENKSEKNEDEFDLIIFDNKIEKSENTHFLMYDLINIFHSNIKSNT